MSFKRWIRGLLAVASAALAMPALAGAVTIRPTTGADEYNQNPGACSLREAIESANTDSDANADGCTQGSGPDVIELAGGTVYGLSIPSANPGGGLNLEGDLDISTDDLTITAPPEGAVIDGNGLVTGHRALEIVNLMPPIDVLIRNVTVTDGGGPTAAPADNGGGIAVNGVTQAHTLTVINSTISANRGIDGGGIQTADQSVVTLRNTTVSGNVALVDGGGINSVGKTILNNVTVSANRADFNDDSIGQGGGVYDEGNAVDEDIEVSNSIIAGNADSTSGATPAPDCAGVPSGPTGLGRSLIGSLSGCDYTAGPGDVTGADPRLAALSDNSGPSATHALLKGSPAINGGKPGGGANACEPLDQRGVSRALGGRCDIGAYELVRCGGLAVNRVGTGARDVLFGTPGPDGFLLFGGNDVARGAGGNDRACGGAGSDRLFGGGGKDRLLGQAGNDRVLGGRGADRLVGGGGRDRLIGGPGRDRLLGGGGRDRLLGAAGRDRLLGGAGRDLLLGGGGRDVCKGGPGRDRQRRC